MPTLKDYNRAYIDATDQLFHDHSHERARELAVGGDWDVVSALERAVLDMVDLPESARILDVGCGPGRLAMRALDLNYIGVDIAEQLITTASQMAPHGAFCVTDGLSLPFQDGELDAVCFFSVFTHLPHEATFLYLAETVRVLKPSGTIIASFLEFTQHQHWPMFQTAIDSIHMPNHLVQFIERPAWEVWADRLGLKVAFIDGSDRRFIIEEGLSYDDDRTLRSPAPFIQSLAFLQLSDP